MMKNPEAILPAVLRLATFLLNLIFHQLLLIAACWLLYSLFPSFLSILNVPARITLPAILSILVLGLSIRTCYRKIFCRGDARVREETDKDQEPVSCAMSENLLLALILNLFFLLILMFLPATFKLNLFLYLLILPALALLLGKLFPKARGLDAIQPQVVTAIFTAILLIFLLIGIRSSAMRTQDQEMEGKEWKDAGLSVEKK